MTFAASAQLIREYREYVSRCKTRQIEPMDCEAFYLATLNGQQILDWSEHDPKRLDSTPLS